MSGVPQAGTEATALLDALGERGVTVWVEGSRLRYRAAKGAFDAELRARVAAGKAGLVVAWRERAGRTVRVHPATHGQRALWFLHRSMPQSSAYNVLFSAGIRSPADVAALREACQALVDRHPSLRTTFAMEGNRLVQRVHEWAPVCFRVHDREGVDLARLREEVIRASRVPFDLDAGALLRVDLFQRAPDDFILLLAMHHIAVDGWSVFLLLDDLRQLYAAEIDPATAPGPRPAKDVTDFARWQEQMLSGPLGKEHETYWSSRLPRNPAPLELFPDRPRPPTFTDRGATLPLSLGAELSEAVRALAAREGTTPFVVLLAGYQALLHRYTGQEEIIVGSPTYGRDHPDYGNVVGDFVNMIPLHASFEGRPSFTRLLAEARRTVLEGMRHQDYPFPLLVEKLQPQRDPSRTPLFQTIFILQKFKQLAGLEDFFGNAASEARAELAGLTLEPFPIPQQEGQFELSLELVENRGVFEGVIKYNTDLYDRETIARMAGHYRALMQSAAADPSRSVRRLQILDADERRAMIVEHGREPLPPGAGTRAAPADGGATLHGLFEARARLEGGAVAMTCGDESVTYGELNRLANRVAHVLRDTGVGPGDLVGLALDRGTALVAALLGILKSGAAYLPIDLVYPPERAAFMLADAKARVLLTTSDLREQLPALDIGVLLVDEILAAADESDLADPEPLAGPDDLAYVIYTSGTTGKPKGTLITHRNVVRLFACTEHWYGFNERDVWTFFHSHAFDFSVWEIWGAFLYGGRLVVVPYLTARSPREFRALLAREQVTVLNQTPSAFLQLIAADEQAGEPLALRYVIFGGEALEPLTLRPWFDRHGDREPRLVNMYGITETTVHVTYRPITRADLDSGSVIGVPIPDLRVHILDGEGEPVPVGVPGELYVGGAGVARGYLDRDDLTAARFVPDHLTGLPGARLYRTGDLARFLPGGDIQYLGRIDQQVKIRGFRIELEEIQSVLCQHPHVREAVVIAREDDRGEKRLVAYVVADDPACSASALREHLAAKLPQYMVPAAFVTLSALPLTPNGKIDRRALPAPDQNRPELQSEYVAPRTPLEHRLAGVWAAALGLDRVGMDDNFFELGGHSLLLVHVHEQLNGLLDRELPVTALFQYPTIAKLAEHIERRGNDGREAVSQARQRAQRQRQAMARLRSGPK